jgi:4-diphosphocytidyl-2-C-methyl-D-erythritol kinase
MGARTPTAAKTLKVHAPAKINLSLRVVAVRTDGYHELQTIFQSIALHDTLTIRADRGPFRLEADDPACPRDSTNLVWRAAEQMWVAAGRHGAVKGFAIRLTKRIPMQAGLGGGSSDGAAAIRAVGALLRVSPARQRVVAVSLGADVPYFLEGGTALGLGRGDRLYPLIDQPSTWVVLVLPSFGVSTKDAFGWWDEAGAGASESPEPSNDLQAPVAARYPEINRIARALTRAGASYAAMSGSGSAVFGLFTRRVDAQRAAGNLAGRTRRTLLTRTLDRADYQRLAGVRGHRIHLPIAPRSVDHA